MQFDDVLKQLGQFGRYQRLQYCLVCFTSLTAAFQIMSNVYLFHVPNSRCRMPPHVWPDDSYKIQNDSHRLAVEFFSPKRSDLEYDKCHMYNSSWEPGVNLSDVVSNRTRVYCPYGWVFDKSEFTDTFMTEFNLVCTNQYWKMVITQGMLVGILVGSISMGWLSDRIGRKKTILICAGIQLVQAIGGAFVKNPIVMTVDKFMGGLSTIGLLLPAYVLGMEQVGADVKLHAGLIMPYVWSTSVVGVAGIAYLLPYWRHLQIAGSIPSFFYVTYWWLLNESPRWLLAEGRIEEARAILEKVAKCNKTYLPPGPITKESDKKVLSTTRALLKLFTSRIYLPRMIVICLQWAVIAMVYYGLSLNSGKLEGNIYINSALSGLVEIVSVFLPHVFLNLIGRRIPHVVFMLISGLSCISTVFIVLYTEGLGAVFTTLALVGKCFDTASFNIIYIWTAELLPTPARTAGIGCASMIGRIGTLLAPVIGEMDHLVGGKLGKALPLIIFGILTVIVGLASIYLPETLNKPLPQSFEDGERMSHPAQNTIIDILLKNIEEKADGKTMDDEMEVLELLTK